MCTCAADGRSDSRIAKVGITNRSAPTPTSSPSTIASVSGSLIENVVPLPRLGLDLDPSAQRVDVALDDVHADAAARDLGDLLGGREPGRENQLMYVGWRQHRAGGDQAVLDRLLSRIRSVFEPGAVVGNLDDDVAALVEGAQRAADPSRTCRRRSARRVSSSP